MKWLLRLRVIPLWAAVVITAVVLFATFFCALLPLSGVEEGVGAKRARLPQVERLYEPLGSDKNWCDAECYPWVGEVTLQLLRASSGAGAFAYSRSGQDTTPPIREGMSEHVPERWRWGVMLNVGRSLFHLDWNLHARYQFLTDRETRTVSQTGPRTLIPLKSVSLNGQRVNTAEGTTNLNFNQLDFGLSKQFHFPENVLVTSMMGLRTTWLKNQENARYTGGPVLPQSRVTVNQTSKYWGIGPMGGLGARWLIFDAFYLIGRTATSLEYTQNRAKYEERQSNDTDAYIDLKENQTYLAPTLDMSVGFGIVGYTRCDEARFSLDLTYDTQILWRRSTQIEVQPFNSPRYTRPSNDVTFQGFALTCSIRY